MTMGEVYGLCLLLWLFSYFIIWIISWIGLSSFFSSLCSWLGWSVLTLFLWAYDKDPCEVWGAGLGWWRKLVLTDCGPSTYWVAVGDMRLVAHRTINKQCLEYFINILMLRMQIIIIIEDAWNWFVHSYTNILSTEVLSNVYFFWGRERERERARAWRSPGPVGLIRKREGSVSESGHEEPGLSWAGVGTLLWEQMGNRWSALEIKSVLKRWITGLAFFWHILDLRTQNKKLHRPEICFWH